MYLNIFIFFVALIFFSGCANNDQTLTLPKNYQAKTATYTSKNSSPDISDTGFYPSTNISQNKKLYNKKMESKKENGIVDFKGSGYIKGIVEKVYYSKKREGWVYHIKGIDLTHGKLRYAYVLSNKKLANPRDSVYAIISDGTINSIYIYKKSQIYSFHKKRKFLKKVKKIKRKMAIHRKSPKKRHRVQAISAPKEEVLTF